MNTQLLTKACNAFRNLHRITVSRSVSEPVGHFKDMNLHPSLKTILSEQKFEEATPIQAEAIPAIQAGTDIFGLSKTGSGKTLAYLLPQINSLLQREVPPRRMGDSPKMLVVTPTRELGKQVFDMGLSVLRGTGQQIDYMTGGSGGVILLDKIKRKRSNIWVSTPGILLKGLRENFLTIADIQTLVLDEADHLLGIGFKDDIIEIRRQVKNPDLQTLLFSATRSSAVDGLVSQLLRNPYLSLSVAAEHNTLNEDIEEHVLHVRPQERLKWLTALIKKFKRVLVFTEMRHETYRLCGDLLNLGLKASYINSDLRQSSRNEAIQNFKTGVADVLVATNVAARGLDIKDVDLVVNYEPPRCTEDYIHRIGRTGRAGKQGLAVTLVTPDKQKSLNYVLTNRTYKVNQLNL